MDFPGCREDEEGSRDGDAGLSAIGLIEDEGEILDAWEIVDLDHVSLWRRRSEIAWNSV